MSILDSGRSWARRQGAPVTVGIIAGLVVMSLFFFFFHMRFFENLVVTKEWYAQPWSLLTYPFAFPSLMGGMGLIGLLFTCWWMIFAGAEVERTVGSRRFAIFWIVLTVLAALAVLGGALLMGRDSVLAGPYLPMAGLTVAWGTRNPNSEIRMYGIIPITGKILAWLTVGIVFFGYGYPAPLLGLFACLHLGLAYAFAANRIPGVPFAVAAVGYKPSKAKREQDDRLMDEVRRREQERQERERLRKLFERSMIDEEGK